MESLNPLGIGEGFELIGEIKMGIFDSLNPLGIGD